MSPASTKAMRPTVSINGQLSADAHVFTIQQFAGASPDTATLEIEKTGHRSVTSGKELSQLHQNDLVEIVVFGVLGINPRTLHVGRIAETQYELGESGVERIVAVSRTDRHMFGDVLDRIPLTDGAIARPMDDELIINPTIDGQPFANMVIANRTPWRHIIDPDTVPLRPTAGGPQRLLWSLADLVFFLCWELNSRQLYFRNPGNIANLVAVMGQDRNQLRNVRIPKGVYLPEALDRILRPYGYQWRVAYDANRTITVERRGGVQSVSIPLQKSGVDIDSKKSIVKSVSMRCDRVDQSANVVSALGAEEVVEATFNLMPAWDPSLDSTPIEQLGTNSDYVKANPTLSRVWRDWVLNEGGEYTGKRPGQRAFNVGLQLTGASLPLRRRRFLPTISQHTESTPFGEASGVFVEISLDGGQTWKSAAHYENATYDVLDKECGIRFTDQKSPPVEFLMREDAQSYVRVRVTASVQTGYRLRTTSQAANLTVDRLSRLVDKGDAYQLRRRIDAIQGSSPTDPVIPSVLAGKPTTAVDETGALQALTDNVVDDARQATVDGVITLNGIDHLTNYWAKAVKDLTPRGIAFRTSAPGTAAKLPAVVGIKWNVQEQTTELQIGTVRGVDA